MLPAVCAGRYHLSRAVLALPTYLLLLVMLQALYINASCSGLCVLSSCCLLASALCGSLFYLCIKTTLKVELLFMLQNKVADQSMSAGIFMTYNHSDMNLIDTDMTCLTPVKDTRGLQIYRQCIQTIKMLHCKQLSSAKQTSSVKFLPKNSAKYVYSVLCVGCRAQRDFLQKKVFDCEGSLAEAKADRKESERDRKIHEAVTNLKRLFPGMATPRLATALNMADLAFSLHLVIGIAANTLQTGT